MKTLFTSCSQRRTNHLSLVLNIGIFFICFYLSPFQNGLHLHLSWFFLYINFQLKWPLVKPSDILRLTFGSFILFSKLSCKFSFYSSISKPWQTFRALSIIYPYENAGEAKKVTCFFFNKITIHMVQYTYPLCQQMLKVLLTLYEILSKVVVGNCGV